MISMNSHPLKKIGFNLNVKLPLCKVLTHNVKLPVRFHELSSDLWIFRTACDGLSVVLDCRNEAHLRAGCVYVDHFILLRIKRQTLNIKYSTWKKWVQFRWTIEILWHSRNGINPLGRMDWHCLMGMWVIAVPLPLPTHTTFPIALRRIITRWW